MNGSDSMTEEEFDLPLLRSIPPEPRPAKVPVLSVFVIDSGWNTPIDETVRANREVFERYLGEHRVYWLTHDQSAAFLKRYPKFLRIDPIVLFLDREALARDGVNSYGYQANLGILQNPRVALAVLKYAVELVAVSHSMKYMIETINSDVYKEGIRGAIQSITSHVASALTD